MMIRHHLSDDLLMAYAAGAMPEAFALVVATHLSLCDECQARAMSFDALGGAVVESGGVDMRNGSLEACLARIETLPQANARAQRKADGVLPAPLVDYVGGGLSAVKWRSIGMGVRQAILPSADTGATARLLYIPGGAAIPDHGHSGLELTLVLQGAFRDATDRFGPGDIEVADASLDHLPVAEAGQACICLAATQGPLKFNTVMPRMLQSFFRI